MNGPQDTTGTERSAVRTPEPPPQAPPAASQLPPPASVERSQAYDPRRKSPILSSFLSIIPGLGQVYIGYYRTGFTHAAIFAGTIAVLSTGVDVPLAPLLGLFLGFFWLYNIIDAGRRAALYNQALAGVEGVVPPEQLGFPGPGGSVAGGLVLIVIGVLFLSNTVFDISWAWMEDWWPVAPILFGVYLVWKGLQERS